MNIRDITGGFKQQVYWVTYIIVEVKVVPVVFSVSMYNFKGVGT